MRRAAAVALAGAALTLAAAMFATKPLYVPALALVIIGLLVPVWTWLASRDVSVARTLHAERVLEDEPLEATLEVRHGPIGLPGGELREPLAGTSISLRASPTLLHRSRSVQIRVVSRFARRGLKRLAPPTLLLDDPLDLSRVIVRGEAQDDRVLVLPRTERVRWRSGSVGGAVDAPAGHAQAEPLAAVEVDGTRPYRPGTPASRIHWSAFARGAGLFERRLLPDSDSRPVVVLDARCPGEDELLDAAVRAAASLVLELSRRTGCGLLLPGERRPLEIDPELAAWPAAHARLALVERSTGPPPALAAGSRLGEIFYVAATALTRVPAGVLVAGTGSAVLVLPAELAATLAAPVSFDVAGCRGFAAHAPHTRRVRGRAA